jgi:hypothetical protein
MSKKREKCNCPKCKIKYDKLERKYSPYCNQYDVWLDFDGRVKDFIEPEHAYRAEICFIHGRPTP